MTIITDTSFMYALYNAHENRHPQAMQFASQYTGETLVPSIILPEVSFLFSRDLGYRGVQSFLKKFNELNNILEHTTQNDIERVYEISISYSAAKFDLVDCCIMAMSERLNITQVCTFDRRDFSIFRPLHCEYLELLP